MTNLADWTGPLAYVAVFVAAVVEGEVMFVAASMLVGVGQLSALGVVLAGGCGAAAGDQLWFYVLRGGPTAWLARLPAAARHCERIRARVQRHHNTMILAIRFLPGLRIAIAAACALAGVSPWRYSLLNTVSAFVWAAAVLACVAWLGPRWLATVGLSGWWAVVVPGLLVLLFFKWLSAGTERP